MNINLYQVDSFTDTAFKGNPAGVCLLSGPADETWMQNLAAEMNLSEAAFLYPDGDHYQLRWFTPVVEVDLCGHATLASAHILWETGLLREGITARFQTRSGELRAEKDGSSIKMDFPAIATDDSDEPTGLTAALGIKAEYIGKGRQHYLVQVANADDVAKARPDFSALLKSTDFRIILTAKSSSPHYDIVSRFFAPSLGINEDPVTGSAHCCLAPFWYGRTGMKNIRAYQASARGGRIDLEVRDKRVILGGQAVTVFHLKLLAKSAMPD